MAAGRRPMTGPILGIDPGAKGAIALLGGDGRLLSVDDMPDVRGAALGTQLRELLNDLRPYEVDVAWVEQVHAMPRQGVASTWRFAENYGAILGALGAMRIPVEHVTPNTWKRSQRVTADKSSSRQRFCELWPDDAELVRRVRDDGRAEAALIARHGWMAQR